ncbi:SHO1 osmosensor [Pseudohyphozyma bogoriensis]|nr:SHO1 osmosensor [Pseudohyphozyma bogoriensis]
MALDLRPMFSHPLFLFTTILAFLGWVIAFIGQVVFEAKYQSAGGSGSAVGAQWFGIFLQLFVNIGTFFTLASNSISTNRFQLSVFLAVALVFAVLGTNAGIFSSASYRLAMGAGYLILSVVDLLWLLYFSSDEESFLIHLLNTGSSSFQRARRGPTQGGSIRGSNMGSNSSQVGQGYNAYSGVGKGGLGGGPAGMSVGELSTGGHEGNARSPTIGDQSMMEGQGQEYIVKAKALYSYSASPDDPNEISFTKGDILDIVDNSGKWCVFALS